ncbi:phosphoenolpyruvate synthase [Thiotrichales bacterium 19S9-12]|nr:phosphoenolpyruvate synthase [Thiotrichales bacterium 19S9-11]MCF6812476.1 phosphoenolpyruvate synthase [Thiotrichales bacterium 19S9-12]
MDYILSFNQVTMKDLEQVGGKNASLGEMISHLSSLGVRVPNGFATTADAYRQFLAQDNLDQRIYDLLDQLNVDDLNALSSAGSQIRQWIMEVPLSDEFKAAIKEGYELLKVGENDALVAVRSSATAEDLPDASFAGQQETFLNISGIEQVFDALRRVFASLFTDRAISYRAHRNFNHREIALSAGVQMMVRSDQGASGVMFSVDTESGFKDVVFITSSYGLGEMVVQGAVNPDEFYVHKPTLMKDYDSVIRKTLGAKAKKMIFSKETQATKSVEVVDVESKKQSQFSITDAQVLELAKYAMTIENHYGRAMDIEWGLDGIDGKLYILQARPETVVSRKASTRVIERYSINNNAAKILAEGRSIGKKIGDGTAKVIHSVEEIHQIQPGDVIVTDMTDPDWEPVMKIASAIVTNRGGRTCHAAIIAREMGIPAVVGCSNATETIINNQAITVSCAQGDTGYAYEGKLNYEKETINIDKMPEIPFKIMMNIANPERAFDFQFLPNSGVGLARLEFIINNAIGIHPNALLQKDKMPEDIQKEIEKETAAYESPREFYIQKLAEGIGTLAAAFYPKPVIVRLSDFKSNEYANLLGGSLFEPEEENPMIGFRGASRYVAESFKPCFEMECEAVKRVRNQMGLKNLQIMIPFVRTLDEAEDVISILKENGLERGQDELKVIMMCELPTNAVLAEDYLKHFDGFSIGSNDMTQLTLGLDRDSALVAHRFDERDPAVKAMLSMAIQACNKNGKYIGICGQGPSDHADFAEWLIEEGIGSVSLNPDTIIETWLYLAKMHKNTKVDIAKKIKSYARAEVVG